jgi:DHA2 family metal-tetracycline-proton antiporter-like MFS transporter/DHA2 family florfenicol/chloramphenicol resistance protein-like MFS transporter
MICALAPSLTVLVFGRIVQGVGGAAIPALAIVSVARVLPPGERGAGIGLIGSSLGAAAAIGPVVGGLVGQFLGWRALFVGTLVLALVLIPFARRVLPNGASEEEQRFDLIGGMLLGLAAENLALYSGIGYTEYDRRSRGDFSLVYMRKHLGWDAI